MGIQPTNACWKPAFVQYGRARLSKFDSSSKSCEIDTHVVAPSSTCFSKLLFKTCKLFEESVALGVPSRNFSEA
jgi:hypothetical protein